MTLTEAPTGQQTGRIVFNGCTFSAAQENTTRVRIDAIQDGDSSTFIGNRFGPFAPLDHAID